MDYGQYVSFPMTTVYSLKEFQDNKPHTELPSTDTIISLVSHTLIKKFHAIHKLVTGRSFAGVLLGRKSIKAQNRLSDVSLAILHL